jgi:hypothetical protein
MDDFYKLNKLSDTPESLSSPEIFTRTDESPIITSPFSDNNHINNHAKEGHNEFSILELILNCFLHVFILFFFLYFLFIVLIAPISQNAFKGEIGGIVNELMNSLIPEKINLDTMSDSELDQLLSNNSTYNNLDPLSKIAIKDNFRKMYAYFKNNPYVINNYIKEYSSTNFLIKEHNDDTLAHGQAIVIFLFVITALLFIILKYYYPNSVNIRKLLTENIITFIFVGMGEYWFFTTYAVKFVPAPPSLLSKSAIDTIKARMSA